MKLSEKIELLELLNKLPAVEITDEYCLIEVSDDLLNILLQYGITKDDLLKYGDNEYLDIWYLVFDLEIANNVNEKGVMEIIFDMYTITYTIDIEERYVFTFYSSVEKKINELKDLSKELGLNINYCVYENVLVSYGEFNNDVNLMEVEL